MLLTCHAIPLTKLASKFFLLQSLHATLEVFMTQHHCMQTHNFPNLLPLHGLPSDGIGIGPDVGGFPITVTLFCTICMGDHAQGYLNSLHKV